MSTSPDSAAAPARITFHWDEENAVSVAAWYGDMTDEAMLAHYRRHYAAPGYDPACRELVDMRALGRNRLTTEGLKKLAALARRHRRTGLTAIVTTNDLTFGLGRMYNVFGPDGTNRIEVFRDLAEALPWLGVSAATVAGLAEPPAA